MKTDVIITGVRANAQHTLSVIVPNGMTGKQLAAWRAKNQKAISALVPDQVSDASPVIISGDVPAVEDVPG